MVAADTNVIVRFLTRDDPAQAARAASLLSRSLVWISKTVLLETAWVLQRLYGIAPVSNETSGFATTTLHQQGIASGTPRKIAPSPTFFIDMYLLKKLYTVAIIKVYQSEISLADYVVPLLAKGRPMPDASTKRAPAFHSHELVLQLFNAVFDSSPVGVGVCDADLRIVVVNSAWAAMDGLAPEDHMGKTVLEVLGVVACPVDSAMRHVLKTGEPIFGLEVVAKVPARSEVGRWVVNLIPLKDESGNTSYVGNVTIETTRRTSFESFLVARGDTTHHGPVSKPDGQPGQNVMGQLSPREIEVTRLLAQGKSNKEIALVLRISVKTVETHRRRVMKNLNFHSLAELAVYAVHNRII